ncbi:hypothetical protein PHLCEN_2v12414 [Hermanssonia centrifuga]|uniref:BTB domain-containing protein n=1 Tax=Hermanssonia centrifuga TaxID=98765 RepID=A0A2R6NH71_9APHY|nr:hypothetical protein PHLCEN_2v12414 [Hermanssonia centrifuga]
MSTYNSPYGSGFPTPSSFSSVSEAAAPSTEKIRRHPKYYLNGGDVHFLVEGYLFRVHRYFFERESAVFREKLGATPASGQAKGSSDAHPFPLDNVRELDFSRFLWVFYNPKYSIYDANVEEWTSILRLAYDWRFAEVKRLACRYLEKFEMDPVDKIELYQMYEVDKRLLIPSYISLVNRLEPLNIHEGRRLSLETALLLATARECARGKPLDSGRHSPTIASVAVDAMVSIIREVFGLTNSSPSSPSLEPISEGTGPSAFTATLMTPMKIVTSPPVQPPGSPTPISKTHSSTATSPGPISRGASSVPAVPSYLAFSDMASPSNTVTSPTKTHKPTKTSDVFGEVETPATATTPSSEKPPKTGQSVPSAKNLPRQMPQLALAVPPAQTEIKKMPKPWPSPNPQTPLTPSKKKMTQLDLQPQQTIRPTRELQRMETKGETREVARGAIKGATGMGTRAETRMGRTKRTEHDIDTSSDSSPQTFHTDDVTTTASGAGAIDDEYDHALDDNVRVEGSETTEHQHSPSVETLANAAALADENVEPVAERDESVVLTQSASSDLHGEMKSSAEPESTIVHHTPPPSESTIASDHRPASATTSEDLSAHLTNEASQINEAGEEVSDAFGNNKYDEGSAQTSELDSVSEDRPEAVGSDDLPAKDVADDRLDVTAEPTDDDAWDFDDDSEEAAASSDLLQSAVLIQFDDAQEQGSGVLPTPSGDDELEAQLTTTEDQGRPDIVKSQNPGVSSPGAAAIEAESILSPMAASGPTSETALSETERDTETEGHFSVGTEQSDVQVDAQDPEVDATLERSPPVTAADDLDEAETTAGASLLDSAILVRLEDATEGGNTELSPASEAQFPVSRIGQSPSLGPRENDTGKPSLTAESTQSPESAVDETTAPSHAERGSAEEEGVEANAKDQGIESTPDSDESKRGLEGAAWNSEVAEAKLETHADSASGQSVDSDDNSSPPEQVTSITSPVSVQTVEETVKGVNPDQQEKLGAGEHTGTSQRQDEGVLPGEDTGALLGGTEEGESSTGVSGATVIGEGAEHEALPHATPREGQSISSPTGEEESVPEAKDGAAHTPGHEGISMDANVPIGVDQIMPEPEPELEESAISSSIENDKQAGDGKAIPASTGVDKPLPEIIEDGVIVVSAQDNQPAEGDINMQEQENTSLTKPELRVNTELGQSMGDGADNEEPLAGLSMAEKLRQDLEDQDTDSAQTTETDTPGDSAASSPAKTRVRRKGKKAKRGTTRS